MELKNSIVNAVNCKACNRRHLGLWMYEEGRTICPITNKPINATTGNVLALEINDAPKPAAKKATRTRKPRAKKVEGSDAVPPKSQ